MLFPSAPERSTAPLRGPASARAPSCTSLSLRGRRVEPPIKAGNPRSDARVSVPQQLARFGSVRFCGKSLEIKGDLPVYGCVVTSRHVPDRRGAPHHGECLQGESPAPDRTGAPNRTRSGSVRLKLHINEEQVPEQNFVRLGSTRTGPAAESPV